MSTVVARSVLGVLWPTAMPAALGMLFVVSQLDAIVDWSETMRQGAELPWSRRAAAAVALTGGNALATRTWLTHGVYGSHTDFVWSLPLDARRLAASLGPAFALAALPAGLTALLLGPGTGVAVWTCAAVASGAATAGDGRTVSLAILLVGGMAGPWGVATPLLVPWLFQRVAEGVRAGRPLGNRPVRSAWWARGPVAALGSRDVLAIARTRPRAAVFGGLVQFFGVGFVMYAMQDTWSPDEVTVGGLVALGLFGAAPAGALSAAEVAAGPGFLDRSLPVSAGQRMRALFLVGGLAVAPAVFAGLLVQTSSSPRLVSHAIALSACATWAIAHPTRAGRSAAPGVGIWSSVALTLVGALLGPVGAVVELLIAVVALEAARRRLERPVPGAVSAW